MNANKRKMLEDAGIIYPSVVTNADRIRNMSDEELAIAFAKLDNRGAVVFEMAIQSYRGEAVNKWLAWLKQEADT